MSAYENWSDEDARDYLAAGLCDTHWHSCIPKPCDESQSKADQLIALAHSGPDLAAKDARIAELEALLEAADEAAERRLDKSIEWMERADAAESALAECREREAKLGAELEGWGARIELSLSHDLWHPGVEVEKALLARLRAILDGGEGQ